jgi:imidazolonepropionase-like amidohydrolase
MLPPARRTIDVKGSHILPGIVDPEAHPGYAPLGDDLERQRRAAACAGIFDAEFPPAREAKGAAR